LTTFILATIQLFLATIPAYPKELVAGTQEVLVKIPSLLDFTSLQGITDVAKTNNRTYL